MAVVVLWLLPLLSSLLANESRQSGANRIDSAAFESHDISPITSLRELRNLTPAEAAQGIPVDITGIITYFEIARDICMIQNEDGAAYVHFRKEKGRIAGKPNLQLKPGDRVRLRGVTNPGGFSPSIWHPESGNIRIEKKGKAPLPEPMRLFPTVILDPPMDNYRVEVTGVATDIRTQDGRTVVTFNDGFDDFELLIKGPPQPDQLPEGLLNSRIVAEGVYSAISNNKRELIGARFFLPSANDIRIVERGAESVFEQPPLSYDALTGYRAVTGERIHVEGVVTAAFPPYRLYLRMEDGPLEIRTNQEDLPPPGTKVGVAGYRGLEKGRPYLHTVALRTEGASPPPPPSPISITSPMASMRHGELVVLEAELADTFMGADHSLLLLKDGRNTFTARLPEPFSPQDRRRPPNESLLQLTGILQHPTEEGESTFRLQLRGFDDIEIIRRPPFWTVERIAAILAVLALSVGALVTWSLWLRHKVHEQARILAATFESEKVQEERNRISRELHDTLEQDLVAIGMQLNLASDHFSQDSPTARNSLDAARRILRRTRRESRHSIQDLREEDLLLTDDINPALLRMVERFQIDNNAPVVFQLSESTCHLEPLARRHVLFILREALYNAIRHAEATEIILRSECKPCEYIFEIADNGKGFRSEEIPYGHFGLKGMQERARLIKSELQIESTPGKGTLVRLSVKRNSPDLDTHAKDKDFTR